METFVKRFEKCVVLMVLVVMMVAVLLSALEVGIVLVERLREPPVLLLDISQMLEVFGLFLMVVIGLELIEAVRVYLHDHRVHAEVVLLVAMVAVSRKVIILDYDKVEAADLLGMAALTLGLAGGWYLVRYSESRHPREPPRVQGE